MLLLIIVLVLLFGGVGPWYGYNNGVGPVPNGPWGASLPLILLIVVLFLLLGR